MKLNCEEVNFSKKAFFIFKDSLSVCPNSKVYIKFNCMAEKVMDAHYLLMIGKRICKPLTK